MAMGCLEVMHLHVPNSRFVCFDKDINARGIDATVIRTLFISDKCATACSFMPQPQLATLLPEVCSGAICAFCHDHSADLLKCGRCKRAWYCSKEHQKEDYNHHKSTCRTVAPFIDALIETIAEAQPSSYDAAQRLVASATLYARQYGPEGPIAHNIFSCLSNTVFCRVCFKLREQLPPGNRLVCCQECWWGWCCREHWPKFEPQHKPHCAEYATYRRLNKLSRQQAEVSLSLQNEQSIQQLTYPMGKVTQQQQEAILTGDWSTYRMIRAAGVTEDDVWRLMTSSLAVPLTVVWATKQLYSSDDLAGMQEVTLHLVGAADFEFAHVVTNTAIEEVLHLLPPVRALSVVLVGPEWKRISPGPLCSHFDKDTCPPCDTMGCSRRLSIFRGTYEDFAGSKEWSVPTLAVALNSGVGCEEQQSWARAVEVLLDKGIPSCFTCMNAAELDLDVHALQAAGALITHQGLNTFRSLVPLRDFDAAADNFYYTNGCAICFRGRQTSDGS